MRIIAGKLKGLKIHCPPGPAVRPTRDAVRETLFQILAPELAGTSVLDLFSGSGALGLEALSRGARAVTFVESNSRALASLEKNLSRAEVGDLCTVFRGTVQSFLKSPGDKDGRPFGVVLADPPYRGFSPARLEALFGALTRDWMAAPGIAVLESSAAEGPPLWMGRLGKADFRVMGRTRISIVRLKPFPGKGV
jgi:16S rRNA (guanine966-N2)-methyltransferase